MKQNTGRWKEELQKGTKNAIKREKNEEKHYRKKKKRRHWKQEKKKKQEVRRLDANGWPAANVRVTATTEQTTINEGLEKKKTWTNRS